MKPRLLLILAGLWLVAVLAGTGAMLVYEHTPGKDGGKTPARWAESSVLPHRSDLPTLVMFAHPMCPCTRASIGELAQVMTDCQGLVNAEVVFYRPKGSSPSWAHSDLWRSAAAIPGVSVRWDDDGKEARKFRVATSGEVVLYDPAGNLLFSGGITDGRGHSGDNAGRSSVVALLQGRPAFGEVTLPTFGCSLQDPQSPLAVTETSWKQ